MDGLSTRFVGVGTGGVRIVARLAQRGWEAPPTAAVHTRMEPLREARVEMSLLVGRDLVGPFGTGGRVDLAQQAAEASREELRALWDGVQWACVVAALGGGTGGGVAPMLCRLARDAGVWTMAICTLPFFFEGAARRRQAEECLRAIRSAADAVIVLPNQRLIEWVTPGAPVTAGFELMDEVVSSSLWHLWRLVSRRWLLPITLADLQQMLHSPEEHLAFASFEADGPDRAARLVQQVKESPILEYGRVVATARHVLLGLVGGPDLKFEEVDRIVSEIREMMRVGVEPRVGVAVDPACEGKAGASIFATEARPPETDTTAAAPASDAARSEESTAMAGPQKAPTRPVQGTLNLESPGKGRFKGVEPTCFGGEDLDVPTFLRRGLRLSREP